MSEHGTGPDPQDEGQGGSNRRGRLSIVGTPLGNLGDITYRAVEVLKKADRILAEDTRHSRNLLNHLGIAGKPMATIEAHVPLERLTQLLQHLERGEWLALVTDAGMPAVSDPGARFVALVREANFAVDVIPGPSAVTAAVALSGLVEGPFYFAGFLPRQGGKRTRALDRVCLGEAAAVLFEAPGRVGDTLTDLAQRTPSRRAAICRELTKLHEEVVTGTLEELAALDREWRGEVVMVLADPGELEVAPRSDAPDDDMLLGALRAGETVRDLADASGLGGKERRAFYTRLLELQKRL
jgi:16S rRNA (cytidine1402-2'-O)-methyltransferase